MESQEIEQNNAHYYNIKHSIVVKNTDKPKIIQFT